MGYRDTGTLPQASRLGSYITLLADELKRPSVNLALEDERPLSPEQGKLVLDHLPLARSVARQFAPNKSMRDLLETRALEKLENLVRSWDATRGVTFGAFAKPRLFGAMRDYIRDLFKITSMDHAAARDNSTWKRPKVSSDKSQSRPGKADVQLTDWFEGRLPGSDPGARSAARARLSGLTQRYKASGGTVRRLKDRQTASIAEDLQRAMARLNQRQRAVFIGRVLTHPPVSLDELGRQLGIRDVSQISRIKRQAERKVAKALKSVK